MATANSFDESLIAASVPFGNRAKALLFAYCISVSTESVGGVVTINNHKVRKDYASQVLNNPDTYVPNFVWAAAANQTLANDVLTIGNTNANFNSSTTSAQVDAAIAATTASTLDADINNAVAAAFNAFANA